MAEAPYNPNAKGQWLSTARSIAKALAAQLSLPAGSFNIRTNKGGIAVPGEVILHGENLYLCVGKVVRDGTWAGGPAPGRGGRTTPAGSTAGCRPG